MMRTASSLIKQEGPLGFYRGLAPSLMRESSYSSLRLGLYEPIRDAIVRILSSNSTENVPGALHLQASQVEPVAGSSSLAVKFAAGATSGILGSGLANPADLIKVRMQSSQTGNGGQSLARVARDIYTNEGGIAGLWQGVKPSMARAAVLTACQVATYDHVKGMLSLHMEEGLPLHAACAFIAGFIASAATTPLDVVKTRLMAGRQAQTSARQVVSSLLAGEGALAMYKGFLPTWLRIGPHTLTTFVVYEKLRAAVGMKPV